MRFEVTRASSLSGAHPGAGTTPLMMTTGGSFKTIWVKDINTIDDLVAMSIDEGPLIITAARKGRMPCIEIYDDYQE